MRPSSGTQGSHTLDHIVIRRRKPRRAAAGRPSAWATSTGVSRACPELRASRGGLRAHGRAVAGQGHFDRALGDDGLLAPRAPLSRSSRRVSRTGSSSTTFVEIAPVCPECCATSPLRAPRSSRASAPEHLQSGKPIVYTSADSVFQVAAHEEHFGLDAAVRDSARSRASWSIPLGVGRVIARPVRRGAPGGIPSAPTTGVICRAMPPPRETSPRPPRASAGVARHRGWARSRTSSPGRGVARSLHPRPRATADGMQQTIEPWRAQPGARVRLRATWSTSTCSTGTAGIAKGYRARAGGVRRPTGPELERAPAPR